MNDMALVAALAAGTLVMRLSLITLLSDVEIPQRGHDALALIAPAVLAGLVAQTLFIDGGELRALDSWYLAAAVAAIVALRTRSLAWTLAGGMAAVWLLEALWP